MSTPPEPPREPDAGPPDPPGPPGPPPSAQPELDLQPQTFAARVTEHFDARTAVTPLLMTVIAFLVGGLVVLATGGNPIDAYRAIFDGTGLNWLWAEDRDLAAINLQQTLILTTPLILCGLAVAYAFRAGLFNIGAQGQYVAGSIIAVWVGSSWASLPGWLHIVLAIILGSLAGAAWGAIAGGLRAATGANEVITTIMLNYTALWLGVWLFGLGGPLQNNPQPDVPVSNDVLPEARLPVFWGDPELQGLHIGVFVALVAAFVFWLLLNRSIKGYEARAVGFNPEAARYGGIHVGRTYVLVMALCGLFAGLAGTLDMLGWQFRLATNDIQISEVGFLGIAVALLGRNTAIGTCAAALLFGALLQGTSVRNLDPTVLDPALAQNLTRVIQGIVVLLVSADYLLAQLMKRRGRGGGPAAVTEPGGLPPPPAGQSVHPVAGV